MANYTERIGIYHCAEIAAKNNWLFREQPIDDIGIDAHMEFIDTNGKPKQLIALQIKTGESYFKKQKDGFIVFRDIHERQYFYWTLNSLPCILILYNPKDDMCIWQKLTTETIKKTKNGKGKSFFIKVPVSQVFLDQISNRILLSYTNLSTNIVNQSNQSRCPCCGSVTYQDLIFCPACGVRINTNMYSVEITGNTADEVSGILNHFLFTKNGFMSKEKHSDEYRAFKPNDVSSAPIYLTILNNLLTICQRMQNNSIFYDTSENIRNDYLYDMINMGPFRALNQRRESTEQSEKSAYEPDIVLYMNEEIEVSILECLNIRGKEKHIWQNHIQRLLLNNNVHGNPILYMLYFIDCNKTSYYTFVQYFCDLMKQYNPQPFSVIPESFEKQITPWEFISCCKNSYCMGNIETEVYHIFVHMGK